MRLETFKFWDLVRLILETLRYCPGAGILLHTNCVIVLTQTIWLSITQFCEAILSFSFTNFQQTTFKLREGKIYFITRSDLFKDSWNMGFRSWYHKECVETIPWTCFMPRGPHHDDCVAKATHDDNRADYMQQHSWYITSGLGCCRIVENEYSWFLCRLLLTVTNEIGILISNDIQYFVYQSHNHANKTHRLFRYTVVQVMHRWVKISLFLFGCNYLSIV